MEHPLTRRIAAVLALNPSAPAVEYEGRWLSWGELADHARHIGSLITECTGARHPRVGIMLRNRPEHVAALLGVFLIGGTVVVINPSGGDDRVRADLAALRLPVLVGQPADLTRLADPQAATAAITLPASGAPAQFTVSAGHPVADSGCPAVAVLMLTSGTTGPPKRVELTYDMLARSVMGADPESAPTPTELRRGVAIVNSPLVHVGGVFRVLLCVTEARPFVLLEKFELHRWLAAVREHRPGAVSLVPAALRTVLHSEATREDLASVRVVTSGTAPLSAEDAEAFTDKFGIPVLTSYAATEFGGGVASWTLSDHRRYWALKRGSAGRANPGTQLRVVDDDGSPLGPDQQGLLEVKPAQLGTDSDWMRTTDLARIDADGFLWILGRADQAIIRGGFKVIPDHVRAALEAHPAVAGAAVVGCRDARLGEVPVAMVELRRQHEASGQQLLDFLRTRLSRYEIPTEVAVVAAIPRTVSGKPDLTAVSAYFGSPLPSGSGSRDR